MSYAEDQIEHLIGSSNRLTQTYLDRMEMEEWKRAEEKDRRGTIAKASRRRSSRSETDATKGRSENVSLNDIFPEIISLEDEEDTVNLMIYGSAGSGKTVFAGSADRVLFLAPEDDGTISAKRQNSTAKKWPNLSTFEDWANAVNRIAEDIDAIQENFDWLAIDSITHLQRLTMRQILDDAVEDNPDRDPDIPQMQDWQKYQNMFLRFVQMVNDLPINVIWTALVRTEEDEEGDDFLVPDIQGKGYQMALTVASYMTSYGYLENSERAIKRNGDYVTDSDGNRKMRTVRTIHWQNKERICAKDRTDVLAPSTVDLTLQQVHQLITGEKTREDLAKDKRAAQASKAEARNAEAKKAPAKKAPAKRAAAAKPRVEEVNEIEDHLELLGDKNDLDNN